MIDIAAEKVFPLTEAPGHLPTKPGGKKTGVSTIWRWTTAGVAGVRLETVHVGHGVFTSSEALQRFVNGVTEARAGRKETPATPSKAGERASRLLEAAGI